MTPNDLPEEQSSRVMHKASGELCHSYHGVQPPCNRCAYCGDWIRPEEMNEECRGYDPAKGAE